MRSIGKGEQVPPRLSLSRPARRDRLSCMKTRVLLVRHGSTVFSAEERFAGSSDVPLSDEGRELARRLCDRLSKVQIDAAYCSDMQRTRDTCAIVLGSRAMVGQPTAALR